MVGNVIDVIVYVKIIIGHVSIICSMRKEFELGMGTYEAPFKGFEGGVEEEKGRLLAEIKRYWEGFWQFSENKRLLAVDGLNEDRLVVVNDSGLWLRSDKDSGWWLAPWGVVLGRFDKYSDLVRRPWDRQEGFVAVEEDGKGGIREIRITSVEEVVEVLLRGREGGLSPLVSGELSQMPPRGRILEPGQVLTLGGYWKEALSLIEGEVYLMVMRQVNPNRRGLELVRRAVVPLSVIGRRGLGGLFKGRGLDVGGEENWFNREGGGRKKKRRRRR